MVYRTKAVFFDGLSSASHNVDLQADAKTDKFIIQPADSDPVLWELKDIHYERYGNYLEIKNKKDKMAFLRIEDELFIKDFLSYLRRKRKLSLHDRFMLLGTKRHWLIGMTTLLAIIVIYLLLIPVIAEKAVTLIPLSFDQYIGNTFMADFIAEDKVDVKRTALLNDFAFHLELGNHQSLNFTVVNSEEVNAFALPNGHIVLYTGLLQKMESYEELAGLLAHEAVHINERHSVRMLCRNLSGYIFLSLLISDVNGLMATAAENAHHLNALSYSRKHEEEADLSGAKLLIDNKIDPNGMLRLFERLVDKEDKTFVSHFLSTHPVTEKRMEYIEQYIQKTGYQAKQNIVLSELFEELKNCDMP